jgi:DNA-directed RNA polymerase specialized sigma24 family protein
MDRDAALAALAPTHAEALRLRDAGLTRAAIAERLTLEQDEVEPLLRVAEAKLDRLLCPSDPTTVSEE